jgi:hypothetical protein
MVHLINYWGIVLHYCRGGEWMMHRQRYDVDDGMWSRKWWSLWIVVIVWEIWSS